MFKSISKNKKYLNIFRNINKRGYAIRLHGQPNNFSHPHLLSKNELTVGVPITEYKERRDDFMKNIPNDSVVLIESNTTEIMTNDIPYRFRQHTDFWYFSGFGEPNSLIALRKDKNGETSYELFVPAKIPDREMWDGTRTGTERAVSDFGANVAYKNDEIDTVLSKIIKNSRNVYYTPHDRSTTLYKQISPLLPNNVDTNLVNFIHQKRWIKTKIEKEILTKAAKISTQAFISTMRQSKPNVEESFLDALLEFECIKGGAQRLAYPPVVAGGISANTLHYVFNDNIVKDGELVLIDAGSEYYCYSSDITRTYPVNGKFSPAQKALYEGVLNTQLELISQCKKSNTVGALHLSSVYLLSKVLVDLGIIKGYSVDEIVRKSLYRTFYPHGIGHYLGMDVHDTPTVSTYIPLVEGNFITIEPGLYIPDDPSVPPEFRGIGIRIEDDVFITDDVPFVPTEGTPKTFEQLEQVLNKY
eukprot:TRINITY_DN15276_c0_g1_i1.p1 TRINITY_DN15276_c0_g1~~TRINITY_DN15276_c0_g1_i1.p1  ORF type:complete len:472 (-),score=105.84 TRINITY_DN15276_c0_g1_i1:9-1424(-)